MASALGRGVYNRTEAARLLGVSVAKVTAWFKGWNGGVPILRSDYEDEFGGRAISFLDFVDAAVAVTLRHKHDFPAQVIRKLRKALAAKWHTDHPFSRQELYVDDTSGKILIEIAGEADEIQLEEVLTHQSAMPTILLPFLKLVEYNPDTRLAQIMRLTDRVVLDPTRRYGKPIVQGTGMPTRILYECYAATRSYDVTADWYSVDPEDVEAAVAFEKQFSGIAA